MKTITLACSVILAYLANEITAEPTLEARAPSCVANNCARAVIGSRTNVSPYTKTNDCNSFLGTYVFAVSGKPKSTQTNTFIPTYAAQFCENGGYSSACSCLGATRTLSTVTAPTPTCTGGYYQDFCGNRWQRMCGMALVDSTFGPQQPNIRADPDEEDFEYCGGGYNGSCSALNYNLVTGQTIAVSKPFSFRADPDSNVYVIQEPRLDCSD